MFRVFVGALGVIALALPAAAQVQSFPGDFRTQEITTDDGAMLHIGCNSNGIKLSFKPFLIKQLC